jgi:hypothetical protein
MFIIAGLDPDAFAHYFRASDAELAAAGARRVVAEGPGYPCRVSLADAPVGEELVLCAYVHHDVASPYRGAGPIFVRRAATAAVRHVDVVPPALARRVLSVRAYDADGDLRNFAVTPGSELPGTIGRLFADPAIAYLHAHNAGPGCFAARIDRHG